MNISSLAGQIYQAISNQASDAADRTEGARLPQQQIDPMLQRGLSMISDMNVGDVISGEIISTDGNNILLSLGDNAALQATLNQGIKASEGQMMTFMIKGNDAQKIALSPLYENLNQNPMVNTALSSAGLPVTDKLQYMVKSMMEEGLSIDRQSLFTMNRAMNANPNVDPLDLARMQRLHIPLTEDMVEQFEQYKNYEHALTGKLSDLSDSLSGSYLSVLSKEGPAEAVRFFDDMMKTLFPAEDTGEEATGKENGILQKGGEGTVMAQDGPLTEKAVGEQSVKELPLPGKETMGNPEEPLSQKQLDSFVQTLKDAGFSDKLVSSVNSGAIPQNAILKAVLEELGQRDPAIAHETGEKAEMIRKLSDHEGFRELLKHDLGDRWLLKPEEVAEEGKVERLYEKLHEQTSRLTESLSSQGRQDTQVFQAAGQLNQNLEFMNQINQNFQYVQIPLKMANGEENGELYVYRNKRQPAEKEGDITALLHLDMENLGPVDVHVTLNRENAVKTKFYLKDDASLDLIAEHIDLLNERLNKRGYSANAEFINQDETKSPVDRLMENEGSTPALSEFSFDARA